jgi:hypothetical protein
MARLRLEILTGMTSAETEFGFFAGEEGVDEIDVSAVGRRFKEAGWNVEIDKHNIKVSAP